jgi:cytidylate kinase
MFRVVTIGREFGSAGKTIGKLTAERLNIAYYDKELLSKVAEETGLTQSFVEQMGEYAPGKSLLSYFLSSRGRGGSGGPLKGMSLDEYLWVNQQKVILDIAEKGPCVIVGRCADFILLERDDCLKVFIHASMEKRIERITNHYGGEPVHNPEKLLEGKDRKRKVYYKYFTGLEWGMSQNYHLSLDRGILGIDRCVDIIVGLVIVGASGQ